MTTREPGDVQELLAEIGRWQGQERTAPAGVAPRRVLGLLLGTELYGLEISGVRAISRVAPLTFVPGAPSTILGVTNLRGQMLPVVDPRPLLGLDSWMPPEGENSALAQRRARIVVVAQGDIVAGLLVDGVTEVHDVTTPIEPAPGTLSGGASLIEGQVAFGGRLLVLLHLPNLIARLVS